MANPTSNLISVKFTNESIGEKKELIVTESNGKVLFTKAVKNNIEQLNLSNYTKGVYFLTVRQGKQFIKSFKIIKK